MKNFRRIIVWAMLSIMLQAAGFLFLDQVIFKESLDISIEGEEIKGETVDKDRDINYDIPQDAKDIKVSDDTRYISYFRDDKLMVLDTKDLSEKEITTEKGDKILYAEWIMDQDILMIAQVEGQNLGNPRVNVLNYNVKNSYETRITDNTICSYNENVKIDDIELSTLTNTAYIGISRTGYNSIVYRLDVNYNLSKVATVGQLKVLRAMQREDVIVYQDSLNNTINASISGKEKYLGINNIGEYTLIDVDDEGIIYLGKTVNDEITSIVYGDMDDNFTTWKTINLNKGKELSDIYIAKDSQILVNDRLKGAVVNLTNPSNKEVKYDGRLQQISENFICSINDGKIIMKSMNEENDSLKSK